MALCSVCTKPLTALNTSEERDVCSACYRSMANVLEHGDATRAARWGATHKCKCCGDALPLSRQIYCLACEDQQDEHPFELFEVDFGIPADEKKNWRREPGTHKRCQCCKRLLPVSEYGYHRAFPDHLTPACFECRQARQRKYEQKYKAKRLAAKEKQKCFA